jgi:N-methylation
VPQINRNSLVEAADQVAAHIRYTQQLAMNDNKFDPNDPNWFKKLWRIQFSQTTAKGSAEGWTYTVYYDSTMSGNPNGSADLSDLSRVDFAIDPQNPNKILSAGFQNQAINRNAERINKKLNLSKTYDIRNVEFTNCGDRANQTIVFDSYGRPMGQVADSTVPYDRLFVGQNPCTITLTNNAGEHALITIQPETGYVNYTLASNTGPGGQ